MLFDVRIGPVIPAAAIAGLVNVPGRRDRQTDDRRRIEKRTDLSTALLAEITRCGEVLRLFDLNEAEEIVVGQIETDATYRPLVPPEQNDTIFLATIANVRILPEQVIGPVARSHNQVFAIDAIISDMRSSDLRQEPQSNRIAVCTDDIVLRKEALRVVKTPREVPNPRLSRTGAQIGLAGRVGAG
jgi:hypothetical protein